MYEGFKLEFIDVGDAILRVRHGGAGPPVLLLHGHPRTHATSGTALHRFWLLITRWYVLICAVSDSPRNRLTRQIIQDRQSAQRLPIVSR